MENRTGDTKNVLGIHFSVFSQIVGVEKRPYGVFFLRSVTVPVQESLAAEHRSELLAHALKHLLGAQAEWYGRGTVVVRSVL